MKKLVLLLILNPLFLLGQTSDFIHIDQFGYKPNHTKVAVISNPQIGFNSGQTFTPSNTLELRNASTNAVVFSGIPTVWNSGATHSQSGDKGWWFDFSSVTQTGDYYIYDVANNERSSKFTINNNIYNDILITASKAFYYNRCGIARKAPYALNGYIDGMSFNQDKQARDVHQQNNASTAKDMSGGWYDAGDYNKYVNYAEAPVHDLLWAYTNNPTVFGDNWKLPESGNSIPDIIDEVKWETDWLLKMIGTNGAVYMKIGGRNYDENSASPPSINSETRYYEKTCTSSTIAATSMFAHASKVFSQFSNLSSYAQTLKDKALLTWSYVEPRIENGTLEDNCDEEAVMSSDSDRSINEQKEMALNAAIYLFDITNDAKFQEYVANHLNDINLTDIWSNYHMMSVDALLYFTTISGVNTTLKNKILDAAKLAANNNGSNYFEFNNLDLYRAYANDWAYHWGSNIQKSNYGNLNYTFAKHQINPSANAKHILRAKEHLHYFHGVNPLGLVYLSNMNSYGAEKSCNQIYHAWFADGSSKWDDAQSSTYGPAPGYVPGGCNDSYEVNTNLSPPYKQPKQKSYLDFNTSSPDNSWEISEPSITAQAAYVRLLSQVIGLGTDSSLSTNSFELNNIQYALTPNPIQNNFKIISDSDETLTIAVFNIRGQEIRKSKLITTNQEIDYSTLASGIYFLKIKNDNHTTSIKFIKQ